jgi:hypothetical protein
MAALSEYLESGILNHIFRTSSFEKPTTIAIALTSSVPLSSDDGTTIPELPQSVNGQNTNYARIKISEPETDGDDSWSESGENTGTVYQLYSNQVNHSGYFYPLYLSDDDLEVSVELLQFEEFPNTNFFSPTSELQSGVTVESSYFTYTGPGSIKNKNSIVFTPAITEWGWVSGIAILDSDSYGQGNLLMYSELSNPRYIYPGDAVRFDADSLEINLN